ncbi:MAG: periplasmic heavy metal sensor [candidate division Zixibacteria bacterium]|nr:periplasmic heavy metal sensor [candidate division Zixibacteria bacterium]
MSMDTKYKLGIWFIAVLIILNIGLMSVFWIQHWENQRPLPRHEGKPTPEEFLILELGFNEDQARTYYDLRKQHMRQTDPIKFEIYNLSLEMTDELFNQSPDSSRMRQLSEAIGDKHAEFEHGVYEHFQDVKQICNPDQQIKLKQLVIEVLKRPLLPPPGPRKDDRRRPHDDHRPPPPGGHRPPPPINDPTPPGG